jgi:molybdenum cofactor biosynthesis enzyme MoaA
MNYAHSESYQYAPEHVMSELGILSRRRGYSPPLLRLDTCKTIRSDEPKTPPSHFLNLIKSCPNNKLFLTERHYEGGELIVNDGALADPFLVDHEQYNYSELPLAIITAGHVDVVYRNHEGQEETVRRLLPGDLFGVFETADLFNTRRVRTLGNNWKLVAGDNLMALFPGRSMLSGEFQPELGNFREFIVDLAREDEVALPTTHFPQLDSVAAQITKGLWPRTAVVIEEVGSQANFALARHLACLTCQDNVWFLPKPYTKEPPALREMVRAGIRVMPAPLGDRHEFDRTAKRTVDELWNNVSDAAQCSKFDRLLVFSERNHYLWETFPHRALNNVRVVGIGSDAGPCLSAYRGSNRNPSHFIRLPSLKQGLLPGIDPQNELATCLQYIATVQAAEVADRTNQPGIYALDANAAMKAAQGFFEQQKSSHEIMDRTVAEKLGAESADRTPHLKTMQLAWHTPNETIESSRITRRQPYRAAISIDPPLARFRDFPACSADLNAAIPSLVHIAESDFVPSEEQPGIIPGRGVLRISVTGLCNLGCSHCHNEGQEHPSKQIPNTTMSIDEIATLVRLAAGHGARTVRFTGGDPGVYPHFVELMFKIQDWRHAFPTIDRWCLTTNGVAFLEDPIKMQALTRANLTNIAIGIDSIDPGELSRPSSPTGISGIEIFNGVVKPLLKKFPGRIKIDTVFTGPGNELRVRNVIRLAQSCDLPVTVLEVNGLMGKTYKWNRRAFEQMRADVAREFRLTPVLYRPLNEVYLFDHRGREVMKFYQDHCADRECKICRNLDSRVIKSAKEGISFVPCYEQSRELAPLRDENSSFSTERFEEGIKHIGGGPNWSSIQGS